MAELLNVGHRACIVIHTVNVLHTRLCYLFYTIC